MSEKAPENEQGAAAAPTVKETPRESWAEIDQLWEEAAADDAWKDAEEESTPASLPPATYWKDVEGEKTPASLSRTETWTDDDHTPIADQVAAAPAVTTAGADTGPDADTQADALVEPKARQRTRTRSRGKRRTTGRPTMPSPPVLAESTASEKPLPQPVPPSKGQHARKRPAAGLGWPPWLAPLLAVGGALIIFALAMIARK